MKGLSWQAVDRRSLAERKTKISHFRRLAAIPALEPTAHSFPIFSFPDKYIAPMLR
jgi:hypothetical protein